MGNVLSCKQKKQRVDKKLPKKSALSQGAKKRKRTQQIVLDRDRKIIQKDKEPYKVVFDPEGFSVHDLALLGQKNSANTVVRKGVIPKQMGRVEIIADISELLTRPSPPLTPGKSPMHVKSPSIGPSFEIIEVSDYVDDLYLQLLELETGRRDPGAPAEPPRESVSSSTTETNISAK